MLQKVKARGKNREGLLLSPYGFVPSTLVRLAALLCLNNTPPPSTTTGATPKTMSIGEMEAGEDSMDTVSHWDIAPTSSFSPRWPSPAPKNTLKELPPSNFGVALR